ncbi:cation transporter [Tenacibaculum sp. E3R01]|uniref:cation diffusion facilitator family transporter n=1 Tax=unclassified Tenacibaculum TaxID=2635139 RepID=UPI0008942065|nr:MULTISPECIES: cation diffusion facilitator family transporter [unclassified Tenacibaculum]RBW56356.1 cation transporter [Tenacibaculum sp. E3R01]SEE46649.1 cobalt-zinc-cadmium efflux system protein [Tenacibaculum sp. MAR_2010_89]
MGHNHSHNNSSENLATAFFLNLTFTIIEFIGGFFTNSLAIMSDALHDLGDSLSLGLAWYFEKKSTKKPTKKYTYGFKRLSLLGAIINSIILIIGSIFIIKEAIPRIMNPEYSDAKGMMWLALLGILVNGAAVFKLKKGTTINEKVVYLHLIEDVLGWVAVLIASIIMQFWDFPILDPILSLLIALYVLFNVYKNMKESLAVILQGIPENLSIEDIKNYILKNPSVEDVHDFHLWTMDGEYTILTVHVVLKNNSNLKEIAVLKGTLKKELHDKYHLEHITIEFELKTEECEYQNCN